MKRLKSMTESGDHLVDHSERDHLLALYRDLDAEVSAASPRCRASGRCCRFVEYGHTLFLSDIEADFLFEQGIPARPVIDSASCPFEFGGLCTARDRRPIGCRVYFCDPNFATRQIEISERFIAKLKGLYRSIGRRWRYAPLIQWVEELTSSSNRDLRTVPYDEALEMP